MTRPVRFGVTLRATLGHRGEVDRLSARLRQAQEELHAIVDAAGHDLLQPIRTRSDGVEVSPPPAHL